MITFSDIVNFKHNIDCNIRHFFTNGEKNEIVPLCPKRKFYND